MSERDELVRTVNHTRYRGDATGHYESFFVRANHPTRALAFWIRYTIFSPRGEPDKAEGELWAVVFSGERGPNAAATAQYALQDCHFNRSSFSVRVGGSTLDSGHARGELKGNRQAIAWDFAWKGGDTPIFLLPEKFYAKRFPAAKSLVSVPMARFSGTLWVDGEAIEISDWIGSQNHNWGSRHTDRYAWGQVAGFDAFPDSFLEMATAKLRVGPLWMPALTPIVLRHRGREHALTSLAQAFWTKGAFEPFSWTVKAQTREIELNCEISAPREAFVGLAYRNPAGGTKQCLNTKIATCTLRLREKGAASFDVLSSKCRAAFEILTDDPAHGLAISA